MKGRKQHLITDTQGNILVTLVTSADVQDRDAAPILLKMLEEKFPSVWVVWADGGYAGKLVEHVNSSSPCHRLEILRRPKNAKGFVLVPIRWVVERSLAWITRNRRLRSCYEHLPNTHHAFLKLAALKLSVDKFFKLQVL